MKRLTVLGVTGSVGRRTLELVEHFPEEFRVEGMAARGSNPELIVELCRRHRPRALALSDAAAMDVVARALPTPALPSPTYGRRLRTGCAKRCGMQTLRSSAPTGART